MLEPDRRRAPRVESLILKGCGYGALRFLLLAAVLAAVGGALLEGTFIAFRHGWRLAFAPWSYDAPGRPALLGLWRGTADIEGDRRAVVLNLDYRYTGDDSPRERGGRANVAGWVALCSPAGGVTSAYAIELKIGGEPPSPFAPSRKEEVVADPAYLWNFQFTWTGDEMRVALPFARRVGASAVSSTRDPTPRATLRRVGGPVAQRPACG